MSIATECMIVTLHVTYWHGYRLDKEATRRVTRDAGAHDDAARVNKHLVPKALLADIQAAANKLRNHLYEKTLPWKDNGDRLLPRKVYTDFLSEHVRLKEEFEQAVQVFLDERYPAAKDQAAFRLGDLYKDGEYPGIAELRTKFRVSLDIDTVTTANDFRCNVDNADDIRADIERSVQDRISNAMSDVWQRLAAIVGSLAERLNDDGIVRRGTLENLQDLVRLLPGLNILDCPNLERIRKDIEETLIGYDVKDLSVHNPDTRKHVGAEAQRIMDDMSGFMRAFNRAS